MRRRLLAEERKTLGELLGGSASLRSVTGSGRAIQLASCFKGHLAQLEEAHPRHSTTSTAQQQAPINSVPSLGILAVLISSARESTRR